MITHETQFRVPYGDVDRMGFFYHSHYVELFDMGRTELMRSIGLSNAEIEAGGVMLPVLKVEVEYRNPAYYDDLLTVRTTLREMPGVRIKFDYEVLRENGERITTGAVTLAFMHAGTKSACRPPKVLLERLAPFFV
ncbi:MAG: acyl-CoA thioesterase [Rikenella sp.]|nr:acyl-CoA thioesterase [Rikenella sp.]